MESVTLEHNGPLAILTFSNAPLNLVTFKLIDMLSEKLDEVSLSPARALLLRGAGEHFCAGANVVMFKDRSAKDARQKFSNALPSVISRLEDLPIPTIAETQGFCLAAGLEIALACDMIIASESAQFAQVEVHIGTSTLLGGIQRLASLCGANIAREIVFTGQRYPAKQFLDWRIVNRVTADDQLAAAALKMAQKLANGPTAAHAVSKRLVRTALDEGTRSADRIILDIAAPLFETRDMQHGVQTLLENGAREMIGKARFEGR